MRITLFHALTEQEKGRAVERLIASAAPRQDFFLMVVLSVAMAAFGLLMNSPTVVIGSMLIAPMLYPILGLSMGVIMSDSALMRRSFRTILSSCGFAVVTGAVIALLAAPVGYRVGADAAALMAPSLAFAAVAFIAGLAASFALVKEQLAGMLPGVAISVALIPPLASIGIGLAFFDGVLMARAFLLFLVNAIGIVFASMIVFSLMNFYAKRQVADAAIRKEELAIELERAHAEQ